MKAISTSTAFSTVPFFKKVNFPSLESTCSSFLTSILKVQLNFPYMTT